MASNRKNPEKARIRHKRWSDRNPDQLRQAIRRWRINNRQRGADNQKKWRNAKKHDAAWVVEQRCRARIHKLLKLAGARKADVTRELIGCTPRQLVAHIEAQFSPSMSWENRHLWHIDHIKPCGSFDLSDHAQQKACFHFTNLRPLWRRENQLNGAKFRWEKYRISGDDEYAATQRSG